MNELTEFEKDPSTSPSFEVLIDYLVAQLAECIDEKDSKSFSALWEDWVLAMPEGPVDVDLSGVRMKYLASTDANAGQSNFNHSCFYGVAAQRAHNRKDANAAWALLLKANQHYYKYDAIYDQFLVRKLKFDKGLLAATSGGIPGQRVRFKIVALLHQACGIRATGFSDIDSALESIDFEIADYFEKNKLNGYYENLLPNFKRWMKEHPAFKAELKQFFAEGVIKD